MVAIDELVAESPAVAEKIAVDVVIVAVDDAPHRAVALADVGIAPKPAMHADRGGKLLIPLARVVALQGFIREHAGRADLDEIAAELIFQHAVCVAAEEDGIAQRKRIQISPARIVAIVAHAPVALDAAVHLMIHQRAEILVAKRALVELDSAGNRDRSSPSCPADDTPRLHRTPGSRADDSASDPR